MKNFFPSLVPGLVSIFLNGLRMKDSGLEAFVDVEENLLWSPFQIQNLNLGTGLLFFGGYKFPSILLLSNLSI